MRVRNKPLIGSGLMAVGGIGMLFVGFFGFSLLLLFPVSLFLNLVPASFFLIGAILEASSLND